MAKYCYLVLCQENAEVLGNIEDGGAVAKAAGRDALRWFHFYRFMWTRLRLCQQKCYERRLNALSNKRFFSEDTPIALLN